MARTLVKILKGEAALQELRAWNMPDWQARKVLGTARTYGENTVPVENDYSTLTIEYSDGYYLIGKYFRGSRRPK